MLEPQSRQLLLDGLHPPDGHRLDWAVGTTYSLDLLAILTAPVAFAFSDWQDGNGRPTMDPLALLKAVRQYADRICLFCQAGKIYVPAAYQPLLTNLEETIVEVKAPRGGSFHPKLWFLRFIADDSSVTWRVLCLTRNMTFDRSWDTMLCLEGPLREDRTLGFSKNNPIGAFADALPTMAIRKLVPIWQKRVKQFASEIRRVEFAIPSPFTDMAFWPMGIEHSKNDPLDCRKQRVLVVSPFVDDGFLTDLAECNAPMELLSRSECLAQLHAKSLALFDKVWVLDDTAEPEASDNETDDSGSSIDAQDTDTTMTESSEIPLVGLHAKLYVADDGWDAHVWTGSANATKAGFERNVEFLVELIGKKSACGVDAILGQPAGGSSKRTACLADLIRPYVPKAEADTNNEAEIAFERSADELAQALAAAVPEGRCDLIGGSEGAESFAITVSGTKKPACGIPAGCELRAWPISLPEASALPVDLMQKTWVRFEPVSFAGLTSFVAFELTDAEKGFRKRFVLNVPLVGAPDNRREFILRNLLSDPERVMRFLLLLLMDHRARDFSDLLADPGPTNGAPSPIHAMFGSTLFESLLRALDRDPERIDHVAHVISDLRKTPEGAALLPKGLDEIWEPIWSIRQNQLQPRQKDGGGLP
jgi:PLD-like domain